MLSRFARSDRVLTAGELEAALADPEAAVLLAIETAGSLCSAAIARGDTILASESKVLRHGHAEALLPLIDRVMREAGVRAGDIDIVAVTIGPGGFTGIRVGLAAAHGIALAAQARLVGVTAFEAVARGVTARPLLVALDSRRAELYVQLFTAVGTHQPAAILPDDLAAFVATKIGGERLLIAGDAVELAAAALRPIDPEIAPASAPDARGVVLAAWQRLRDGMSLAPVRPLYLRPPDVTMPKRSVAADGA